MSMMNARAAKRMKTVLHGAVTLISSFSILFSSFTASYAQQIIVDPSAPGTSFLRTSNGTPQVNISTPQSGVSVNKFTEFNVTSDGLILNNSSSNGVSVIGQNVTANPNLMVSGPATTIVNEVTSTAPSSLTGTTEVFGQKANVIIANPNGITCNGCSFLNANSSVLTTGRPTVQGAEVDLLVTKGTITIGPDGYRAGQQGGLLGRHVVLNGPVATSGQAWNNSLIITGGAHRASDFDYHRLDRTKIVSAPSTEARTSPFAIDASSAATVFGGETRIRGMEHGLGVNLYGDVDARALTAYSRGDLFYNNLHSDYWLYVNGKEVRQYGDLTANFDLRTLILSDSFTLYDGRKITAKSGIDNQGRQHGNIKITARDHMIIAGEVSGVNIELGVSSGYLQNSGFLMADGDLTIRTWDNIEQSRRIASEYDTTIDPALKQYLQAYQTQLLNGGPEADIAAEMIARAQAKTLVSQYIDKGATSTGTNITFTSNDGSIQNVGGAIAATQDVSLTAAQSIVNTYLALSSRLDAEDGCSGENCGYRTDFHSGEILAGNDLTLAATQHIWNIASDMAAAQDLTMTAGLDVVNTMTTSSFEASEYEAVTVSGVTTSTVSCGKECTTTVTTPTSITYNDLHFDEVNVLAPARMVSLYGDIQISGQDVTSTGSLISSGGDLTINASGEARFESFSDEEVHFVERKRPGGTVTICVEKGSWCTTTGTTTTVREDGTRLVTATSELVGQNISITSGQNLVIQGARMLAANDLSLTSTNGTMLIDSTDLPDGMELPKTETAGFVELTGDFVDQVFGTKTLTADLEALAATYQDLLAIGSVASETRSTLQTEAATAILKEVIADWKASFDPLNPTKISDAIAALQSDPERRNQLAEQLLFLAASTLGDEADETDGAADLNELALLRNLIIAAEASGAQADEIDQHAELLSAALTLLNSITPDLKAAALAIETAAGEPPALVEKPDSLLSQWVFNRVHTKLSDRIPSAEDIAADTDAVKTFEASSIDEEFVADIVYFLANKFSTKFGQGNLFTSKEEVGDALLTLESSDDLQRIILEMSLILSPENTDNATDLSTLWGQVSGGMTEGRGVNRIKAELDEFTPQIRDAVIALISERNFNAQIEAMLQDGALTAGVSALVFVTNDKKNAVLNGVASALGAQAETEYRAQLAVHQQTYLALLADNDLLLSVEALRRAESGADIKEAARAVGTQSFVSLIDSDHLAALKAAANAEITNIHTTIGAQIASLNATLSDFNSETRSDLKQLRDLLAASGSERTAFVQSEIDDVNEVHQTQVTAIDATYQSQLDANTAQYGHLLTTRVQQWVSSGKDGYFVWVNVPNQHYINLKNTADAQAAADRTAGLNAAETQRQIDIALAEALVSDAAITQQIADLSADFAAQLGTYAGQKTVLVTALQNQTETAMRKAELVVEQEAIEDELRREMVAKNSVVEGESSLSASLAASEFSGLTQEALQLERRSGGFVKEIGETAKVFGATLKEQNDFLTATNWRFATHDALVDLTATPRTVLLAENDLNLTSGQDIYVLGETTVGAVNDVTVTAERRIGLLGAINTNFHKSLASVTRETGSYQPQVRLVPRTYSSGCDSDGKGCSYYTANVEVIENVWVPDGGTVTYDDLAYESFVEVGETLQLGTLMRDVYLAEVPSLDGETEELDWMNYAGQTGLYDLTTAMISAGGDLTLSSQGDILNFGGTLVSGEDLYLTAEADIRNEALRHNFTLTAEHGCVAYACGREGHEYKAAELLSGSEVVISAGGDLLNRGSSITAAGSILASVEGDIVNEAITSQYLYHYINRSSLFGLRRTKQLLYRAAISEAYIGTEYGGVTLTAGNDILNGGSNISAGGDVSLTAGRDIGLYSQSEELMNYYKYRGFRGLYYSATKTLWNEFETAVSQVEGNNVTMTAARNLTGTGTLIFAGNDIDLAAGEDLTLDALQNVKYSYTSGWSIGLNFPGKDFVAAVVRGDDIVEAYLATNPTLAAVHQIATADDKWDLLNGLMGAAYGASKTFSGFTVDGPDAVDGRIRNEYGQTVGQALAAELNPLEWVHSNLSAINDTINKVGGSQKPSASGIEVRLGFFESESRWTESHVSKVIAGNDLWLDAGKNLALVGGTIASASRDTSLSAGEDVLITALADWSRSESSDWGVTIGYNGGWYVGVDAMFQTANSTLYTNSAVTAGENLDITSGQDTTIAGANLKGHNVYMDVGGDLTVSSQQNTSDSNSFGFSLSTNGNFSVSVADADRRYTDNITSILATNRLSIYTEKTTYLMGALLASDVGNLELNTASLVFDNYQDSDKSVSVGVSGSYSSSVGWKAAPSVAYSNTQGITHATIGAGTITLRDWEDYDLSGLNRDVDNVQEVVSHREFRIKIPDINLKTWRRQINESLNLLQATTTVPDRIRSQGAQAVAAYQELIFNNVSPADARAIAGTNAFKGRVKARNRIAGLFEQYGSVAEIPAEELMLLALTETALYNGKGELMVEVGCDWQSSNCMVRMTDILEDFLLEITLLKRDGTLPIGWSKKGIADAFRQFIRECIETEPEVVLTLTNLLGRKAFVALAEAGSYEQGYIDSTNGSDSALGFDGELLYDALQSWGQNRESLALVQSANEARLAFVIEHGFVRNDVDVMLLLGFVPVVGTVIDGYQMYQDAKSGDWVGVGANGAILLVSLVPVAGQLVRVTKVLKRGSGALDDVELDRVTKAVGDIAPNRGVRSADDLLTNGRVPGVRNGEFNRWFDDLSPAELDNLWSDATVRRQMERRIREPGRFHEWCMACRAPEFRRWGVSMDEIQRFRTRTDELTWTHPDTGVRGGHGANGSGQFHNELRDIIDNSTSLDQFNTGVTALRDRWQIDASLLPELPRIGSL